MASRYAGGSVGSSSLGEATYNGVPGASDVVEWATAAVAASRDPEKSVTLRRLRHGIRGPAARQGAALIRLLNGVRGKRGI